MRDYILQKFWHEYLGIKANDIKQDACHGNHSLHSCYFCWRARECAFFPNPLSVSPLVRQRILQQNPPAWQANSLFAQLPWYTLFAPSIPRQLFFSLALSSISPRTAIIPRRSENQKLCKILGVHKVQYGRCTCGVWTWFNSLCSYESLIAQW